MSPGKPPRFSVLLPVTRPPVFLPYAVDLVLGQSHVDFELFIVSDGAPAATVAWGKAAAARDPRVRLFDFPKGERHGEAHRHVALVRSHRHICGPDRRRPSPVSGLPVGDGGASSKPSTSAISSTATSPPTASFLEPPGDLASPTTRERMLKLPPEFVRPDGCRLPAERLPPARRGLDTLPRRYMATDLHMWRKFLRDDPPSPSARFSLIQVAPFPDTRPRETWSEQRSASARSPATLARFRDAATRRTHRRRGVSGCSMP